jgi:hypothetical protein
MFDYLWSTWLAPNLAYDFIRTVVVSLFISIGTFAIFGAIMRKIEGLRKNLGVSAIVFICAFILFSYLRQPPAMPQLVTVHETLIMGTSDIKGKDHTKTQTFVVPILDIVNRGTMASVTRDLRLEAKIDNSTYRGVMQMIQGDIYLQQSNGQVAFLSGMDALYNKMHIPIQPGGEVTGLLMYSFDIPQETFLNHKTSFTFSFRDVMNHLQSLEMLLTPVYDTELNDYYPGLNMRVR